MELFFIGLFAFLSAAALWSEHRRQAGKSHWFEVGEPTGAEYEYRDD